MDGALDVCFDNRFLLSSADLGDKPASFGVQAVRARCQIHTDCLTDAAFSAVDVTLDDNHAVVTNVQCGIDVIPEVC
jgi:hypothetical protein